VKKHMDKLNLYVPIVARVHGKHHTEFYEVQKLFDAIRGKIKDAKDDKPDLDSEFKRLREVTDNYTVPNDVCESYEAVYLMLADWDRAYQED